MLKIKIQIKKSQECTFEGDLRVIYFIIKEKRIHSKHEKKSKTQIADDDSSDIIYRGIWAKLEQ